MELGIVGLPNVGKSTLFQALTETEVPSENYPFCTVDPNVGVVPVPDPRLGHLSQWVSSEKTTPAQIKFIDVAGLVENAHEGEGLGNQFLSQIRTVDAVCHVLRLFTASEVTHVQGTVDPLRDIQIIETEFALADLEVIDEPLKKARKEARVGEDEAKRKYSFLEDLEDKLSGVEPVNPEDHDAQERTWLERLPLLSTKPVLYVLNVDESTLGNLGDSNVYNETVNYIERETPHDHVTLSARFEVELLGMKPDERSLFLSDYGLEEPGLNRMVRAAYDLLGLITFFTYNKNELRAWSIQEGGTAAEAAGKIHTDFREGFIRAEVINFETFQDYRSWTEAREDGAIRSRGEDYVVEDGDILRINAQP